MLLAWPEKAKNQDRDLRVVSHRSRVPPQAKKLFIINIGDVNTLLPEVLTQAYASPLGT